MKRNAPPCAVLAGVAFAVLSLILPPAWAGGRNAWKPDTSCATRMKIGKSGRIYGWRPGSC